MRMMERNKSKFFYALYKEKVPKTDEYGNVTGEYEIIRDNPVEFSANISAAKGETSTRQFGESESYDKVIVMGTDAPPIDEYTVLWVDKTPQVDETGALVTNDDGERKVDDEEADAEKHSDAQRHERLSAEIAVHAVFDVAGDFQHRRFVFLRNQAAHAVHEAVVIEQDEDEV